MTVTQEDFWGPFYIFVFCNRELSETGNIWSLLGWKACIVIQERMWAEAEHGWKEVFARSSCLELCLLQHSPIPCLSWSPLPLLVFSPPSFQIKLLPLLLCTFRYSNFLSSIPCLTLLSLGLLLFILLWNTAVAITSPTGTSGTGRTILSMDSSHAASAL